MADENFGRELRHNYEEAAGNPSVTTSHEADATYEKERSGNVHSEEGLLPNGIFNSTAIEGALSKSDYTENESEEIEPCIYRSKDSDHRVATYRSGNRHFVIAENDEKGWEPPEPENMETFMEEKGAVEILDEEDWEILLERMKNGVSRGQPGVPKFYELE